MHETPAGDRAGGGFSFALLERTPLRRDGLDHDDDEENDRQSGRGRVVGEAHGLPI
jgi:hypothetical protein